MDAVTELFGIGDTRNGSFHPNEITIGRVGTSTFYAVLNTWAGLVVSFTNTAQFPIEEYLNKKDQGSIE